MSDTPQSLADRLRDEGDRVMVFFNNLSSQQWEIHVHKQDGEWTLHQLLAHFVSAEIGRKELIVNVSSGGEGAPVEFNIDSFNTQGVDRLSKESNSHLLEKFFIERSNLASFVSSLDYEVLERVGNDPFLGVVPLVEMIKLTYRHLQIHLRDARRCL
jgi:DinB superfamily